MMCCSINFSAISNIYLTIYVQFSLQLNFVGVTVPVDRPYLHFASNKHMFAPVPIGERHKYKISLKDTLCFNRCYIFTAFVSVLCRCSTCTTAGRFRWRTGSTYLVLRMFAQRTSISRSFPSSTRSEMSFLDKLSASNGTSTRLKQKHIWWVHRSLVKTDYM